ncbi:MAG: hypothetical protein D8M59_15710 [Planctomycetes bacterium]|nr:hypothetical protein [Planctomycetota bacterium]NOG54896.1 hypothetical protein [Planctomycetota bacterium]
MIDRSNHRRLGTPFSRHRFRPLSVAVLIVLAVPAGLAQDCDPLESQKILASDGDSSDRFGCSVSMSGSTAVIGAYFDEDNGGGSGSAYAFNWDGTGWREQAKLTARDGEPWEYFGYAVACTESLALIGAPQDTHDGTLSGSAYVYRYDSELLEWKPEAKLLPSGGENNDYFGCAVSISGNIAVVGASLANPLGHNSGAVYVYYYNGTRWIEQATLTAPGGGPEDTFGEAVSVWDDVILVGASGNDDRGVASGAAYVYRFNGSRWVAEATLTASDAAVLDYFGRAVAVRDGLAVISAPGHNGSVPDGGATYVFAYNGLEWGEESILTALDEQSGRVYGSSLAVDTDVVLVGAYFDNDQAERSGAAYLYRYDGIEWAEQGKLTASDGRFYDKFGCSVSLFGQQALIGAYYSDVLGDSSGSAYAFRINCQPTFRLAVSGPCPGPMRLSTSHGTSHESVAFLYGFSAGTTVIPPRFPCAGTTINLGSGAALIETAVADEHGTAVIDVDVPSSACSRVLVQAVDLTTCTTTRVTGL